MLHKSNQPPERRQRPLVPVEQNKIFSYRASRAPESDARQRLRPEMTAVQGRTERIFHRYFSSLRYLPSMIAMAAIVGCLVYNSMLSPAPRIIVSGDAGERLLMNDTATYQNAIKDVHQNSIFNRSKLTYNSAAVSAAVTKQFPEVKSLRISLPLIGQKPIMYIVPNEPRMVLESQNKVFVLDESGRAIADSTDHVSGDILRVRDESGIKLSVGDQAFPETNMRFLTELQHQLAAKNIKMTEAILPASSQSVLIRIEGKPYQIKFSFQGNVLQQAGAFIATYEQLNGTNTNPSEYIDVRVGERVYYR